MDFKVGDEVDILSESVFYSGKVVDILKSGQRNSYRVHYLGWKESFDETISDPARLFKAQTYTMRIKVWVRFPSKMPCWPCIAFIRQPVLDNDEGMGELRAMPKVYVTPCGTFNKYTKPYHHGVWIHSKNLSSFLAKFDDCNSEAMSFKEDFADFFLQALEDMRISHKDALDTPLKFDGSLELHSYASMRLRLLGRNAPDSPNPDASSSSSPLASAPMPKAKRPKLLSSSSSQGARVEQPRLPVQLAAVGRASLRWVPGSADEEFVRSCRRYYEQQQQQEMQTDEITSSSKANIVEASNPTSNSKTYRSVNRKATRPRKNGALSLEGILPTPVESMVASDLSSGQEDRLTVGGPGLRQGVSFTSMRALT